MDTAKIAYAAGLLDGEGCIGVHHNKYGSLYINLGIYNTNEEVIVWLQSNFGGIIHQRRRLSQNSKTLYEWYLGQQVLIGSFLELVEPYVIIKRLQVETALVFIQAKTACKPEMLDSFRKLMCNRMTELNKRGK